MALKRTFAFSGFFASLDATDLSAMSITIRLYQPTRQQSKRSNNKDQITSRDGLPKPASNDPPTYLSLKTHPISLASLLLCPGSRNPLAPLVTAYHRTLIRSNLSDSRPARQHGRCMQGFTSWLLGFLGGNVDISTPRTIAC
jgi:hypothetical protein